MLPRTIRGRAAAVVLVACAAVGSTAAGLASLAPAPPATLTNAAAPAPAPAVTLTVTTLAMSAPGPGNSLAACVDSETVPQCSLTAAIAAANSAPAGSGPVLIDFAPGLTNPATGGRPDILLPTSTTLAMRTTDASAGLYRPAASPAYFFDIEAAVPVTVDFGGQYGVVSPDSDLGAFLIGSPDVTITGLTQIQAGRVAFSVTAPRATISDSTCTNYSTHTPGGNIAVESCVALLAGAADVTLDAFTSNNAVASAVVVDRNASVAGLTVTDSALLNATGFSGAGGGLLVTEGATLTGTTIAGSRFADNAVADIQVNPTATLSGLTITGSSFTVDGTEPGGAVRVPGQGSIWLQGNGIAVSNVAISGSTWNQPNGVALRATGAVTGTGISVTGSTFDGLSYAYQDNGPGQQFSSMTWQGNTFRNGTVGHVLDFTDATYADLLVDANTFTDIRAGANAQIWAGQVGTNNVVSHNQVSVSSANLGDAAYTNTWFFYASMLAASPTTATGWTATANHVDGIQGGDSPMIHRGRGVLPMTQNTFGPATAGSTAVETEGPSFHHFVSNAGGGANANIQTWRPADVVWTGSAVTFTAAPVDPVTGGDATTQPGTPVRLLASWTATDKVDEFLGTVDASAAGSFSVPTTHTSGVLRLQTQDLTTGATSQMSAAVAGVFVPPTSPTSTAAPSPTPTAAPVPVPTSTTTMTITSPDEDRSGSPSASPSESDSPSESTSPSESASPSATDSGEPVATPLAGPSPSTAAGDSSAGRDGAPTTAPAQLALRLTSYGVAAAGSTSRVTARGLRPGSDVLVTVHSTPRQLGVFPVGSDGTMVADVTLPEDLETGPHRLIATGTGADGSALTSETGFRVGEDGSLQPASYDPEDHPGATAAALTAAATLAVVTGALGRRRRSARKPWHRGHARPRRRRRQGDAPGVDMAQEEFRERAVEPGDRGWTWVSPWRLRYDAISRQLPPRLNAWSPMVARFFNDGAFLRAMFGSWSVVTLVAGAWLGFLAAEDTHGHALPPSTVLLFAIVVLSVIDALGGVMAALVYTAHVVLSGGIIDLPALRCLIAVDIVFFSVILVVSATRDLRREPEETRAEWYDRGADVVIGAIIAMWTIRAALGALPGLTGLDLPVTSPDARWIWLVGLATVVRLLLETMASHWFPERLLVVAPEAIPEPPLWRVIVMIALETVVVAFFAASYMGVGALLWIGAAIIVAGATMDFWADRLPDWPRFARLVPGGIIAICFGYFFGAWTTAWIRGAVGAEALAHHGFVLLMLPAFAWACFEATTRNGEGWTLTWLWRITGIPMLVFTVLLLEGMVPGV